MGSSGGRRLRPAKLLQNQAVEAVKVLLRSCTLQTAQLFQGDCVLDVWQSSGKILGEGF